MLKYKYLLYFFQILLLIELLHSKFIDFRFSSSWNWLNVSFLHCCKLSYFATAPQFIDCFSSSIASIFPFKLRAVCFITATKHFLSIVFRFPFVISLLSQYYFIFSHAIDHSLLVLNDLQNQYKSTIAYQLALFYFNDKYKFKLLLSFLLNFTKKI